MYKVALRSSSPDFLFSTESEKLLRYQINCQERDKSHSRSLPAELLSAGISVI